jgi:hypothetical protein
MAAALKGKAVQVIYTHYPGEGHGFARLAKGIVFFDCRKLPCALPAASPVRPTGIS